MRCVVTLILMVVLISGISGAADSIQTDWSGGSGLIGPVTDWTDQYDYATETSTLSIPGQVALSSVPFETPVHHLLSDAWANPFSLETVDIDFDGDIDVIGTAEDSQKIILWLNNGTNPVTFTETIVDEAFPNGTEINAGDIDGDGDLDLVAAAENGGNCVAWWRNDGGSPLVWTRFIVDNYYPVACSAYPADIDQDGLLDILATSWTDMDVTWYRNNGGDPITWTEITIAGSFNGAHHVRADDIDDDGDIDVVAAAGGAHQISWWRNDGGNPIVWTEQNIVSSYSGARAVNIADIDGDGLLDVAGISWNNQVSWWHNDGQDPINWTRQDVVSGFYGGHSVHTADIDGDGRLDLLGAAWNGGKLRWWRNEGGNPINWTQYSIDEGYLRALWVRTGDLDGDGDLEVLGISSEFNSFDWWEIGEFTPAGVIYSSVLDTGFDPELGAMRWTTFEPAGTSVAFSVRSSNDELSLGEWIPLTAPADTFTEIGQYVQYRAELTTADPAVSPIVYDVEGSWLTSSGVEDDSPENHGQPVDLSVDALFFQIQTPTRNQAHLTFDLPVGSQTRLSVFDLSGRLMKTVVDREFAPGHHEVSIDDLSSGIYLCRLQTNEAVSVQRLVVVE